MTVSISSAYPAGPASAQQDRPRVKTPGAADAPSWTDTVKLSQSAQIHAMKQQGQRASQIASSLGVPVASVNSVLGIVVAAPVAAVAVKAVPVPAKPVPVAKS